MTAKEVATSGDHIHDVIQISNQALYTFVADISRVENIPDLT